MRRHMTYAEALNNEETAECLRALTAAALALSITALRAIEERDRVMMPFKSPGFWELAVVGAILIGIPTLLIGLVTGWRLF